MAWHFLMFVLEPKYLKISNYQAKLYLPRLAAFISVTS